MKVERVWSARKANADDIGRICPNCELHYVSIIIEGVHPAGHVRVTRLYRCRRCAAKLCDLHGIPLPTVRVFVSGCYHLLHPGHLDFFRDARALGDYLTVCFASDFTLRSYKGVEPVLPQEHRRAMLKALRMVDQVVMGQYITGNPALDFTAAALGSGANVLAVTDDDRNIALKQEWCDSLGIRLVVMAKRHTLEAVSTSQMAERLVGSSIKSMLVGSLDLSGKP
jgi:cytidyltransferase-like protein